MISPCFCSSLLSTCTCSFIKYFSSLIDPLAQLSKLMIAPLPTSLDELFKENAALDHVPLPEAFANLMRNYCKATRDSLEAVAEVVSSTQNTTVEGVHKLNKFRYASTNGRPEFLSFSFSESSVKEIVRREFPRTDVDFEDTLSGLVASLSQLRHLVFSTAWVPGMSEHAWPEKRLQCMMALFLNSTFNAWYGDQQTTLSASSANGDLIELRTDSGVEWNGYADLKCGPPGADIYSATATFEMKVAMGNADPRLYHSKALQPKQQTLGQAIGRFQHKPERRFHSLSYLTDIFAIAVLYHIEGKAYLSQRVTEPEQFCLRVLLMCCELSESKWKGLLPSAHDCAAVQLEEDAGDVGTDTQPGARQAFGESASSSAAPGTCNRVRTAQSSLGILSQSGVEMYSGTFDLDDEEAHQRRLEELSMIRRWEAKCRGEAYLGCSELSRHSQTL